MSNGIRIDGLGAEITSILNRYRTGAIEARNKAVKQTANEVAQEIRGHITFRRRTGKYEKAFAVRREQDNAGRISYRWYVEAPHYRLSHLLEKGYGKNKIVARAFPHIKYGEELAARRLPELVKKNLEEQK